MPLRQASVIYDFLVLEDDCVLAHVLEKGRFPARMAETVLIAALPCAAPLDRRHPASFTTWPPVPSREQSRGGLSPLRP